MPTRFPQYTLAIFGLSAASLLFSSALPGQELPNLPALTPQDLSAADAPKSAGGPAEILYEAIETDNTKSTEIHSIRLKVLNEQGLRFANVEIPYEGKELQVDSIRARTIDSQGKVSEFTDVVYDREIVKAKKYRVSAKTIALPNVQPGTIIEYSYRLLFKIKMPEVFKHPEKYELESAFTFPAASLIVQHDVYARHLHFVLHAAGPFVFTHSVGLPKFDLIAIGRDQYKLDIENIPPYEEEEYAPPEDTMRARVDVFYGAGYIGASGYWTDFARRRSKAYEAFLKKSKSIERETARIVSPADSDEQKLRKLYERAQKIRAVSFETEKTEKEKKRENLAENKTVEDVLTHGYAFANDINLFYVALLRAAGFEAYPFLVTSRKSSIFLPDWPYDYQLNAMVVQVHAGNGYLYLDPATKYCPYGLLPWDESDAQGMRIDVVIPWRGPTPLFKSSDALTTRIARLRLAEDGELAGKVQLEFLGEEALNLRLEGLGEDDAGRRKVLEETLKSFLPSEATLNLLSMDGWETENGPLKASFEIAMPGFASQAGRRLIIPISLFHTKAKTPFPSARRVHPIDFSYPQENREEVNIDLPAGISVEAMPAAMNADQKAAFYEISIDVTGNSLKITRTLRFSGYLFDKQQYPIIRAFYDRVLSGDAQQITLVPRTANP